MTESPIAYRRLAGASVVVGASVTGTAVVAVTTVTPVSGLMTCGAVVGAVTGVGIVVVEAFAAANSARFRDSHTSLHFSSAVAMLTAAKPNTDATRTAPPTMSCFGLGSLVSCRRFHHLPSCFLRIGISMNRYENSVIAAVTTIARANSLTVSLSPACSRMT
jgi:hypothetical protein